MANPSAASDPFSSALSSFGSAVDPFKKDPELDMKPDKVRSLGKNVGSYAPTMGDLSEKTRAIDMSPLTFGVIGGGLNVVHRNVRDGAADALASGQQVLESWQAAINQIAENVDAAEQASKAKNKNPGGPGGVKMPQGPGDMKNIGPFDPDLKSPGGPKVPGMEDIDGPGTPGVDIPGPGGPDAQNPDIPNPDVPDPNLPDPNAQNPDMPNPNVPDPNLPDPNAQNPDIPNPNVPDPNIQDPDLKGLDQPATSDLAGIDRNLANQIPQARIPDPNAFDPRTTNTMPRTSLVPESGIGGGGSGGAGGGTPPPGSISKALNSGMPFYPPPMGGGAGAMNRDEKNGEGGPYLSEEESAWGFDEEHGPAVIRNEEV
ncbi:hypothetical protein [Nonomuraea sp. NPDC049504]|uniref:hypothetical protein n=1 Tax=Nonomuraea sp. NPDC049504 TaxID=3154729 RepID=UPI00343FF199